MVSDGTEKLEGRLVQEWAKQVFQQFPHGDVAKSLHVPLELRAHDLINVHLFDVDIWYFMTHMVFQINEELLQLSYDSGDGYKETQCKRDMDSPFILEKVIIDKHPVAKLLDFTREVHNC